MWESRVLRRAFERLELHEGKLSRAVLRGGGGGDVTSLPDPGWATTQVYPARITLQGPKAAAGSRQPSSHGTAPTPKFHVVTPNESFSCGEHAKTRLLYKFSTNYQDAHRCPGIWLEFA